VVASTTMRVTLSSDHRVIDGAEAARFLATLKGLLESPLRLVL
jgi:pyruvate dehydrogenase E2 component (dihydrolipoamide acetyltransferase)